MLQAQEITSDESRSESDSDGCVVAAVREDQTKEPRAAVRHPLN